MMGIPFNKWLLVFRLISDPEAALNRSPVQVGIGRNRSNPLLSMFGGFVFPAMKKEDHSGILPEWSSRSKGLVQI
jgi:hypothetical protein